MRVILIAAQSLDGRITFHSAQGATFVSEADKRHFREALAACDCSVMGGETFRVSENAIRNRKMDGRLQIVMTRGATNADVAGVPGVLEFSSETPAAVVADLRVRGKKQCALLGGGQIYGAFLAAGLVDEIWLTLEPRIFGAGVPLVSLPLDVRLKLKSSDSLSADTLLLKYEVIK